MDVLFSKDSYEAEIVRLDVQPSIISLELITLLKKYFELISKLSTLNISSLNGLIANELLCDKIIK